MSNKERSGDRPGHQSSSSGSGGALSFLPSIFGRKPTTTTQVTRSAAQHDSRGRRLSSEDAIRGRSAPGQLPLPSESTITKKRTPSPAPFDPESVIRLIVHADPKDDISAAEVCELVKAIAVHLVDRATTSASTEEHHTDTFGAIGITSADLQTLYIKTIQFANPRAPKTLRTAAKRLLAALVAIAPPGGGDGLINVDLPESINVRTLYRIITVPAAEMSVPPPIHTSPSIDEINVEVGALKALTRNGTQVYKTEGIIGWLVRTTREITEEYASWCTIRGDEIPMESIEDPKRKSPFAPIKPATPAEALTSIIDLINCIVLAHAPLFATNDISRLLEPILKLFLTALKTEITSSTATPRTDRNALGLGLVSHESPLSTAFNSPVAPVAAALVGESSVKRSISIRRKPLEPLSSSSSQNTPSSKTVVRQNSAGETAPSSITSPTMTGSPSVRSPSPPPPHHQISQLSDKSKWPRSIPAFCNLLETLINHSEIPNDRITQVVGLLCIVLGMYPGESLAEADVAAGHVMTLMLEKDTGRRTELSIRKILEGKVGDEIGMEVTKILEIDCRMTKGAISATQALLHQMEILAGKGDTPSTCPLASLAPSISAAQSSSRFTNLAKQPEWEWVDFAILSLLLDHVNDLKNLDTMQKQNLGDAWAEGEAITEILQAFVPLIGSLPHENLREIKAAATSDPINPFASTEVSRWVHRKISDGQKASLILPLFEAILAQLPDAIGHLHASTSQGPPFIHPQYIELLLRLGPFLDEADAKVIIDFYISECLCLPFTSGWIDNIWKLLNVFHIAPCSLGIAKREVTKLLFTDVYEFVEDLPEHRGDLMNRVIVPFLEKLLLEQTDDDFQQVALSVLVSATVADTVERDEEQRNQRATRDPEDIREEDTSIVPTLDVKSAAVEPSFLAIRNLIIKLATLSACRDEQIHNQGIPGLQQAIDTPHSEKRSNSGKIRESVSASGLKSLIGNVSPPSRIMTLPSMSSIAPPSSFSVSTPMSPNQPSDDTRSIGQDSLITHPAHHHNDCKSLHAVTSLIAIFSRLAFSPSPSLLDKRATRTPSSMRCLVIFRDLLGLLFPMTDDANTRELDPLPPKIPARCPRARIIILQWLMRIRADKKHRVYVRGKVDETVLPFAAMLKRTRETEAEVRAADADERRRNRNPIGLKTEEERGRTSRGREEVPRSRSRSKQPTIVRGVDNTYNPLWVVPDPLLFEAPESEKSSDVLTTFDPNHPSFQNKIVPAIENVWLPVSEYVRVLNGILRGHDWELVSYVLCFLPLQLRNKVFFHGHRAVRETRALLDVLCKGVLDTENRWERRYNVPSFIRRVDINAIAYQSLSILISYRGVFSSDDSHKLVQAFAAGLEARRELAKPCLQALTLCIFELEHVLGKHLLAILEQLGRIVTTTALAIHILEFIISLGQNGSLYRNFTDEHYRKLFHVAIDYITIHNARSDQPIDLTKSREDYTLSQHVIGLAYYSIYIWFMALKLSQRPNLVPEITRKLLQGRSQRSGIDEMAEVCFDWLSRYTYGNADPKPANSFLSEVVMSDVTEKQPPKTLSWMLGGAIISITAHSRTGWATICTTRPTGSTAVVCKLENIPHLELGEAHADLISLPAVLMANRKPGESSSTLDNSKELAKVKSTVPAPEDFDPSSQHGFIWSGATPSQRRKDVVIEPSYIAVQLLSSYPNASLETPRGRLIPDEDKYHRALRGIQNTPVIDTLKIAVLYVEKGQSTETDILGNIDGSPLYLDFLAGLGRLIKLKGQVDVFVGGLNRDNDSDGEYTYAWWDDFSQMVFHIPTMMPNLPTQPNYDNKKRLVGNDFIKIIYNESGKEFDFTTIKTDFNFVNIVISPLTIGDADILPWDSTTTEHPGDEGWQDWDREEWFKVEVQRVAGIPDFGPLGEGRLVSRTALPILVRQMAYMANGLAARFTHIRDASDAASAEYITSWRSRLRAMARLRAQLPAVDLPPESDVFAREELLRDFSYRPPPAEKD